MTKPPASLNPAELESPELFDYALIRDYAGYVLSAPLRHKVLSLAVFAFVVGGAALALYALPKTYHVETRILAQRNQVISLLSNPGRSMPFDADAPTRAASETVLRRDNLLSLVKQTDLVNAWSRTRAPALRVKDLLTGVLAGQKPTADQQIDALVGTLEKVLAVKTGEGLVTIAVDWPDGQTAYRLIEAAQQNFLEARHASEISIIAEAISIIESHAAEVHEKINSTMEEIEIKRRAQQGAVQKPAARRPALRVDPPRRTAPQRPAEGQEVTQLRVMLAAKRRAIADLEDFRQRRLAELHAQLTQQKTVYADEHPVVVNIQQSIDALSLPSPQIGSLRAEERELENELRRRGGSGESTLELTQPPAPVPAPVVRESIAEARAVRTEPEDPSLEYARGQLRLLFSKYSNLLDRIDSARIEMATARAAFKYRYSVVRPAQVPRSPVKPKAALVLGAGAVGGLLLAVFAAALADLRSRRLVQRWQVERLLHLPVLAELREP